MHKQLSVTVKSPVDSQWKVEGGEGGSMQYCGSRTLYLVSLSSLTWTYNYVLLQTLPTAKTRPMASGTTLTTAMSLRLQRGASWWVMWCVMWQLLQMWLYVYLRLSQRMCFSTVVKMRVNLCRWIEPSVSLLLKRFVTVWCVCCVTVGCVHIHVDIVG